MKMPQNLRAPFLQEPFSAKNAQNCQMYHMSCDTFLSNQKTPLELEGIT